MQVARLHLRKHVVIQLALPVVLVVDREACDVGFRKTSFRSPGPEIPGAFTGHFGAGVVPLTAQLVVAWREVECGDSGIGEDRAIAQIRVGIETRSGINAAAVSFAAV